VYYIRGLELMKLIFAVLDVSLTMGLTRCYKTEGFFTFILSKCLLHCFFMWKLTGNVVRHSLACLTVHKWLVPFYLKFSVKKTYPLQKRRLLIDIRS